MCHAACSKKLRCLKEMPKLSCRETEAVHSCNTSYKQYFAEFSGTFQALW